MIYNGRYQSVRYDDSHLSNPLPVTLNVAQGSILELFFFILFMNDVVTEVENVCFEMYANDSTLCAAINSIQNINRKLTTLAKPFYHWISVNHMFLNRQNEVSVECMFTGHNQSSPIWCTDLHTVLTSRKGLIV